MKLCGEGVFDRVISKRNNDMLLYQGKSNIKEGYAERWAVVESGAVLGSRLLRSGRAATWQSGSPPGVGAVVDSGGIPWR